MAPVAPAENELVKEKCFHCKKVVVNYQKCVKCSAVFHPACMVQANEAKGRQCFHSTVVEQQDDDGKSSLKQQLLEREVVLLNEIIREQREKYEISVENGNLLRQNCELLKVRVAQLEKAVRDFQAGKAEKSTNEQKVSDNVQRKQRKDGKQDKQMTQPECLDPVRDKTVVDRGANGDNGARLPTCSSDAGLKTSKPQPQPNQPMATDAHAVSAAKQMPAHQSQGSSRNRDGCCGVSSLSTSIEASNQDLQVNGTDDRLSLSDVHDKQRRIEPGEWRLAERRRKVNRARISRGVPTANSAMARLKPLERVSWIYLSNLSKGTTASDILACLDVKYIDEYICEPIKRDYETRVASFRLGVPAHMEAQVKSLDFWVAGTFVDTYRFPRKPKKNFQQALEQR